MKNFTFVFILLFPLLIISKPKDIVWQNLIYFNPRNSFSEELDNINSSGYRLQSSDTIRTNDEETILNKYIIYRKLIFQQPEVCYLRISNDTIQSLKILFDINTSAKIKSMSKVLEKIKKNYVLDIQAHRDEEFCGDAYSDAFEYYLRDDVMTVYFPVNMDENYWKVTLLFNIEIGRLIEDMNNILKKSKKRK